MNILMIIGIIIGGTISIASTVGIVIVLAVAACALGVWLDRAKSDSSDNKTDSDAHSKN